ncbi:hypothetical protein M9H77_22921 [Catharanthus roseus]|uniref:Uncharacterized protein n=1 Tax=Catharanthus roseus TaxID=4058 RepID=A0ACC0ARJ7_CATRO|nr:hypothetical protein M9H77_22921 [Catharanthus roseus]
MVRTNNANVGREGHGEEGGSSRGGKKGKGKQVARSGTPLDKFISVQAAAHYKDWTKKKRKITPGHRVPIRHGRSEDRTVDKLDTYGRILHHIISNTVIPNVWHKSSITNIHSFVILAMHEHRKMNFGYIAREHMLTTQSSSTKCLPYGCFLTKVFQHFRITFFGPNDHIGIGKIYNQNTFKRMGFSRNEDGNLIRGGQDKDSENSKKEEEEKGNDPEESDSETEEERIRRETRKKEEIRENRGRFIFGWHESSNGNDSFPTNINKHSEYEEYML